MKVAIIGGGLAGCAAAYVLKHAGAEPVIYESGERLASGASGNETGLYNPRFTAERNPQSDYYTSAFALALRIFPQLKDIDWNPCGALHLINDEKKEKRFAQTVENWGWSSNNLRLVDMAEASDIAGADIQHDAMYLRRSGTVSPKKLCMAYAKDVEVRYESVSSPDDIDADAVILACGPAVKEFYPQLPIGTVRGQITVVEATQSSRDVKCSICYGGYFSPAAEGRHIVGSSFQRWLDHTELLDEDDEDNINKLAENVPGMEQGLKIVGRRAAIRATSKDHFPMVGRMEDGVYVSAAHGSHGILSSLMAAHLIADMILDRPYCLPNETVAALKPCRF